MRVTPSAYILPGDQAGDVQRLGSPFVHVLVVASGLTLLAGLTGPVHAYAAAASGAFGTLLVAAAHMPGRSLLLVAFFTRLSKDRLLDDGVRPKMVELLKAEPGLGITDVCARLAIGWGTAVHHLNRLERAQLVVSHDSGRRRRFFVAGESPAKRSAVCVLSTELNRRLVTYIDTNPGTSQSALCQALGISAPLAHKYLAKLIEGRFVVAERDWRTVQYFPGQGLAAALDEWRRFEGAQGTEGLAAPA